MLTKNFYSLLKGLFNNDSRGNFTATDGNTRTPLVNNMRAPFYVMKDWSSDITATGVSFGTGTTPATLSDYWLESVLGSTQISVSTPSAVSYSRSAIFDEYSASFGITNKTNAAITISEVGLTALTNMGTSEDYCYVLVDRTVLDTPITIPAGQSKQITYTIRFNYGDAV